MPSLLCLFTTRCRNFSGSGSILLSDLSLPPSRHLSQSRRSFFGGRFPTAKSSPSTPSQVLLRSRCIPALVGWRWAISGLVLVLAVLQVLALFYILPVRCLLIALICLRVEELLHHVLARVHVRFVFQLPLFTRCL